jgi:hypothetical protein
MASDFVPMPHRLQTRLGRGRRRERLASADPGLRVALAQVVCVIGVFAMLNLLYGL